MDIKKTLEEEIILQINNKGFSENVEKELIEQITKVCSAYRSERRMNESTLKRIIERVGELVDG